MNDPGDLPDVFRDLVDEYCSNVLDEPGHRRLESYLLASAEARAEFVSYFQAHTELEFAIRSRLAAAAVLNRVAETKAPESPRKARPRSLLRRATYRLTHWSTIAAGLIVAVIGFAAGKLGRHPAQTSSQSVIANVAWLVNAQDCQWARGESEMPGRDMQAGKVLRLERGLAEIEFDRGARLILQGPAGLELTSSNGARLLYGSLTARVPTRARGFTIYSLQGKVVDLGTEFGLSVDSRGATAVRVFEGKVVASPSLGTPDVPGLTLHEDQAARIDGRTVALNPAGVSDDTRYVRAIIPPPIVTERSLTLDFASNRSGSLLDARGLGVGLTHRLPGTGTGLPERDANLRLDTDRRRLELVTTRSDINTQLFMDTGEYLGFRLKDLGFTGEEDFAISVTIPEIPGLASVGQFGLYAGSRSDLNIRGGLLSYAVPDRYRLFLVNNKGGIDSDLNEVGLISTGDDFQFTLRRTEGRYSLVVENLTKRSSSTLTISHPAFLDGVPDLYVGLFGANPRSDVGKTLTIKEIDVKVWTLSPAKDPSTDAPKTAENTTH
jgi:hypothetical protein